MIYVRGGGSNNGVERNMLKRIDALFAAQFGLVARDQLFRLGVTTRMIERRLESGVWVARERCLYRLRGAPTHELEPIRAATLAANGIASSCSALHLTGVMPLPDDSYMLISRSSKYGGSAFAVRTTLAAYRVVRRRGIPCLDVPHALLTAASVLDASQLADVTAIAINKRMVSAAALRETIDSFALKRPKGVGALREIVERYLNSRAEESVLESRVLRVLRSAGLEPTVAHEVRVAGRRYRLDCAFPHEKVAVEIDGYEFHSSRAAFEADRLRRNQLELAGWLVLNATDRDVRRSPDALVSIVRRALVSRSSRPLNHRNGG